MPKKRDLVHQNSTNNSAGTYRYQQQCAGSLQRSSPVFHDLTDTLPEIGHANPKDGMIAVAVASGSQGVVAIPTPIKNDLRAFTQ